MILKAVASFCLFYALLGQAFAPVGANYQGTTPKRKPLAKQLKGVNRSGGEFACVQDKGIFDGPTDEASIWAMKEWNINAVRIPLNEDCWLGINGFNCSLSGKNYQSAISEFVTRLRENDLVVILELHWSGGLYNGPGQGCYDERALCEKPMPNRKSTPKFWKSVATHFKYDESICFDLFNNPFPDQVLPIPCEAWRCWRDGGDACPGFQYEIAGMQELLDAVRSTGATNLVMIGGLRWANDLSRWMSYVPHDPLNNIAASWHCFNYNHCVEKSCWEAEVAPVARRFPVIAGQIGQNGCSHNFVDQLMEWLDSKRISYLLWTWNVWDCSSGPSLISNYDGTPTEYGRGLKQHLSTV